MRRRKAPASVRASAVCALLALLAACGGAAESARPSGSSSGGAPEDGDPVATPTASRPPAEGKGSEDPDDINGDGHRDLLIPVGGGTGPGERPPRRVAVVFGSAEGPDPVTRTVHDRASLVPPPRDRDGEPPGDITPAEITTADLDGDGYPDFVTRYTDGPTRRPALAVSWGGPMGRPDRATAPRRRASAREGTGTPRVWTGRCAAISTATATTTSRRCGRTARPWSCSTAPSPAPASRRAPTPVRARTTRAG
ncbi:FG-GAP repeat domain-containing protein [Streptomyces sp. MNU89]|uniref:FG-GAP repeat domain-containing protein n=1 Tax=Streptomyces sp. MNU89 TaxID=2560025 RepID=UPI0035A83F03